VRYRLTEKLQKKPWGDPAPEEGTGPQASCPRIDVARKKLDEDIDVQSHDEDREKYIQDTREYLNVETLDANIGRRAIPWNGHWRYRLFFDPAAKPASRIVKKGTIRSGSYLETFISGVAFL
jgi:hypothetical protein